MHSHIMGTWVIEFITYDYKIHDMVHTFAPVKTKCKTTNSELIFSKKHSICRNKYCIHICSDAVEDLWLV